MEDIFDLRQRIARIGSADWFGWWESNSLTSAGAYALERVFRRTAKLTAADLAIRAAKLRHDQTVPSEPLVHLFNFGEEFEGAFGRWLIARKTDGWTPGSLPGHPPPDGMDSVEAALKQLDLPTSTSSGKRESQALLFLGTLDRRDLHDPTQLHEPAAALASGYSTAEAGKFTVPFFRLR